MKEVDRTPRIEQLQLREARRTLAFDTVTKLVTTTLKCPTSLITIVDASGQWVLGKSGFDLMETPVELSICAVCVSSQKPLLVTDTRRDKRFRNNPLVTGSPSIRSYVGVPLAAMDGLAIGVLSAISPHAHAFSRGDVATLQSFALLVEEAIAAHDQANELRRAAARLEEFNQLFHQAETAANIGAWHVDLETNALTWSDQVYAIHGLPPGTPIDVAKAIAFYEPCDQPMVRRALLATKHSGCPFRFEASIRRPNGEVRRVSAMGERLLIDGKPGKLVGVFRDCTEEYERAAALELAAKKDHLSGLLNRAGFTDRMKSALQSNPDSLLTMMLINLDEFKDINERLGQASGDKLLTQIATRIVTVLGDDMAVARWGGDEFAVLFPVDTSIEDAVCLGVRLSRTLGQAPELSERAGKVSATFGIAQVNGSMSPEVLIRRATLALFSGKEHGRGGVHCWTEEIEGISETRQRAIAQVTRAFATGRAFAVYQPIVEVETGKVIALEALLRIREHSGSCLSGSDVFAAMKEPAVSREVLQFMLGQISQDCGALLNKYGKMCKISLNVSDSDLRISQGGEDFVALITRLIGRSNLSPSNIILEVTETMLLKDDESTIRDGLHALDRLGYTIALDDFGTGYSSLTHLRDFPISKVKIDKEFISAISDNHQSRMIVQAIAQMSRSLGLDVIAEGVEDASEEMFLRAIGCRFAQGYRYGRPASLAEHLVSDKASPSPVARRIGRFPAMEKAP